MCHVLTTHQAETGTLFRQNAHDTKKYELKDKNINIWLDCRSFFNDSEVSLVQSCISEINHTLTKGGSQKCVRIFTKSNFM